MTRCKLIHEILRVLECFRLDTRRQRHGIQCHQVMVTNSHNSIQGAKRLSEAIIRVRNNAVAKSNVVVARDSNRVVLGVLECKYAVQPIEFPLES